LGFNILKSIILAYIWQLIIVSLFCNKKVIEKNTKSDYIWRGFFHADDIKVEVDDEIKHQGSIKRICPGFAG